jgi:hypothetical protein
MYSGMSWKQRANNYNEFMFVNFYIHWHSMPNTCFYLNNLCMQYATACPDYHKSHTLRSFQELSAKVMNRKVGHLHYLNCTHSHSTQIKIPYRFRYCKISLVRKYSAFILLFTVQLKVNRFLTQSASISKPVHYSKDY